MGYVKRTGLSLVLVAALAAVALTAPGTAQAHAKHYAGNIGMVVGPTVIPYLHRHHVRIGVKNGLSGGPNHFYGGQAGKAGSGAAGCCSIPWHPFDLSSWNWHGIMDFGVHSAITATACTGFGVSAAAATPTLFTDSWVAALSAAACENGAYQLHREYDRDFLQPRG
jgi:hypothetical protein